MNLTIKMKIYIFINRLLAMWVLPEVALAPAFLSVSLSVCLFVWCPISIKLKKLKFKIFKKLNVQKTKKFQNLKFFKTQF